MWTKVKGNALKILIKYIFLKVLFPRGVRKLKAPVSEHQFYYFYDTQPSHFVEIVQNLENGGNIGITFRGSAEFSYFAGKVWKSNVHTDKFSEDQTYCLIE